MRNKLIFIVVIFTQGVFVSTASGQIASDIEAKYGKPIKAYAVSEQIWMTPKFTGDGQICEAQLYSRRISSNTNYLWNELPFLELKAVLDQLAPSQTRGTKTELFGLSILAGQAARTIFAYEHITIIFLTPLHFSDSEASEEVSSAEKESDAEKGSEKEVEPADEFDISLVHDAEIVTIRWVSRKCANE